jgi:peptidyl-prolyl cis-trans isomerase SurA
MKHLLFLISTLCVFLQAIAASEEEKRVDSILAAVNGEPISLLDVVLESGREEARLAAIYKGKELYEETKKLRKKILDEIIARKLIYEDFQGKELEIPDFNQYVEDTVDSLCLDFGDGTRDGLIKKAKRAGVSLDELKEKARNKVVVEIMVTDYCNRTVSITPKEVYEYYESHKNEFSTPPQINLQMIFLKKNGRYKDDMQSIIDEIKEDVKTGNEKIFKSLSVLHSEGPNAENGGELGWLEDNKLRPEFAKALKGAKTGTVAGPIKTDEGVYFLRVVGKKDLKTTNFDNVEAKIKEEIRAKLKKKAYKEYVDKLREKAIIRYYF